MKLYYFPGACSMAAHITINELRLPVEVVRVDLATKTTEAGGNFFDVNPEGYVPALALDDGTVMTESPAVLQYLCDTTGHNMMLPAIGTIDRYRVIEMLGYVSTEVHQSLRPLVDPTASEEAKANGHSRLTSRLGRLERALSQHPFLIGTEFTIADAYAFAIVSAARFIGVSLADFPNINAFLGRVSSREAVVTTMRAEGIIK